MAVGLGKGLEAIRGFLYSEFALVYASVTLIFLKKDKDKKNC